MIELKCDRCGKDCDLQARVIDVRVISNPNPVRLDDIGEVRLTDDDTHFRYMLCQNCYDKQGLPNPFCKGERLVEEIKKSTAVREKAEWVLNTTEHSFARFMCSRCNNPAETNTPNFLTPYCRFCGAKMDNPGKIEYLEKEDENG